MIDWDDVRYFLAAAQGGSVRAAAKRLGVNHATVLRRIAQLEDRLRAQMFEKLPSGYRLTAAGEEVLEFADQMQASSHQLETRVLGRDQSVHGPAPNSAVLASGLCPGQTPSLPGASLRRRPLGVNNENIFVIDRGEVRGLWRDAPVAPNLATRL
jgi:DNA-binding transcriptional LysR family regulator